MQRMLNHARWDSDEVRDDLRDYVVEHLGDPGGVLFVDETGFLKKGTKSAGVQRQYSGTAGRIENCQVGVFLAYASPKGHALIDRELYLPDSWTDDRPRCREAGIPDQVGFRTKPQLARRMLERALDARVPVAWVTADELYGQDGRLRRRLEERDVPHVLAVKRSESLVSGLFRFERADQLAARVPAGCWRHYSAGQGAKDERVYAWARVAIRPLRSARGAAERAESAEPLVPLSVPEIHRLLSLLVWPAPTDAVQVLGWSWWRRRHQARARACHWRRRPRQRKMRLLSY
jgi:SRSO17 transposase